MDLVERLTEIRDHDWRVHFLAHTSDTAGEALTEINHLRATVRDIEQRAADPGVYSTNELATLRKQVEELAGAGAQCADDLEAEINGRYGTVKGYPDLIKKREQDMAPVIAFRAALSSIRGEE